MKCPECDSEDLADCFRQYSDFGGVIDVGWECRACGWQFGFALSPPGFNKEVKIKTGGNNS